MNHIKKQLKKTDEYVGNSLRLPVLRGAGQTYGQTKVCPQVLPTPPAPLTTYSQLNSMAIFKNFLVRTRRHCHIMGIMREYSLRKNGLSLGVRSEARFNRYFSWIII